MKKNLIVVFSIALCSFTINAYSADVSEKVLRSFRQTFPDAQNVSWQSLSQKFIAQFDEHGIRTIANYDPEGNFLGATRYYTGENLPLNIFLKLKNKYPSKKIYGVTEISTNEGINYFVKMEDETTWMTVKSDESANFETVEKYKKQL